MNISKGDPITRGLTAKFPLSSQLPGIISSSQSALRPQGIVLEMTSEPVRPIGTGQEKPRKPI